MTPCSGRNNYEADLIARPRYPDGSPRPAWENLAEIFQETCKDKGVEKDSNLHTADSRASMPAPGLEPGFHPGNSKGLLTTESSEVNSQNADVLAPAGEKTPTKQGNE